MIKAIVFDCFGVLTTDTWRAFVDSLPTSIDIPAVRELNRAYDAGMISREQFLNEVHGYTGTKPHQVEDLLDNEIVKNAPLLDYIRELKAQYKIGLLSNIASGWIRDKFLTIEEQTFFDDMVFSFEVKMTKPDPLIFNTACKRLGVKNEETVMIDDIEGYVSAARFTGMQGVVYKDLSQLRNDLSLILSQ